MVVSLEDYVKRYKHLMKNGDDKAKGLEIKPHLSIHTLAGIVQLDLFAVIQHVPGHWVCSSVFGKLFNPDFGLSNICYFYDDLKGHAVLSKLDLSHVKRTSNTIHASGYKIGSNVGVYKPDGSGHILLDGTVQYDFGNAIIKIKSSTCPNECISQLKRFSSGTIGSSIDSLALFPKYLLKSNERVVTKTKAKYNCKQ